MLGSKINFYICAYVLYVILVIEYLPVPDKKTHSDGCMDVLSKLQTVDSGSDKEQLTVSLRENNRVVDLIILEGVFLKIRTETKQEIARQQLLKKLRASDKIRVRIDK